MNITQILDETLAQNQNKYVQYLMDLVAIDTQDIGHGIDGGREAKGQQFMMDLFRKMQADSIEQQQLSESDIEKSLALFGEGNTGHNYEERYNVYATFKGQSNQSIMFNGHIDTMPPGNEQLWKIPPFEPAIVADNIYGLGVCDMKSGLMASVMAVMLLKDAGIPLPLDVIITSVVDEEGGGNGSIAAAIGGQKASAVVVCEPTDYKLITANMGFVFFKVAVKGKAVHSASKWLGVSAIEKAMKIIHAIDELEHQWLLTYKHPLLPPPSSNVGVIEGGTAGSTIADCCSFKTCVHYLPKLMDHQSVVKAYTDAINRCCEGDEWLKDNPPDITIYQFGGAFEIDAQAPVVSAFAQAYQKVMGDDVAIAGAAAGCDARIWQNIAGCPTIQYGPGRPSECHCIDEYIPVVQYLDAIKIYAQLILEWAEQS